MAESKKILVVGGAGFVGSNLVDRLVHQGHSVVVVDNLNTGRKENVNPCAKLYDISVESEDLKKVFRRENIDIVYYYASFVNDRESDSEQRECIANYISGFMNLMKNVIEFEIEKVILGSTLQVYGEVVGRVTENTRVLPNTYNGILHYTLENILRVCAKENGFKYSILRCSNIYGKRQTDIGEGGMIQRYINTLKRGSIPVIVGDENAPRDYIYIADVVNANIKLIQNGDGEIYNIGIGESKSILKMINVLINKINPKATYLIEKGTVYDLYYSDVSINKAINELGWRPVCSVEFGLEVTCKENE